MKLFALLILLVTFSANAQDTLVIGGDTIPCEIIGVEATGVAFIYLNMNRRAALEMVDAMYYRNAWYTNMQVRKITADRLAGGANTFDQVPIVKLEPALQGASLHLDKAGTTMQIAMVSILVGVAGSALLAENSPVGATIMGIAGGVGSLIMILLSGDHLRKAARALPYR